MPTPRVFTAAARPLKSLFVSDAFGGILLIAIALLAIAAANSAWAEAYHHLFHGQLSWTPIPKLDSLHLWINDALMAIFFFVVGLEVKREIVDGALADPRSRRLPVLAAAAGMAVPAAIFLQFVAGDPLLVRGWAIPAATDIAFAMGVIGLLGSRVPPSLRLFLLTVAIVDDIGAVLVIALFYTAEIDVTWLVASTVVLAGLIALNRCRVDRLLPFILGALLLWLCVLYSGVHATIAGVVAALTIPMQRRDGGPMLMTVEHALVGWNAYLVVPLFGFANAGVALGELGVEAFGDPLPLAVGAGLVIGKQLGIFTSVAVADRIGFARRPAGASWGQLWGTSVLCGIGFTMSLFISALAFPDRPLLVEEAKLGILLGSAISALLGYIILRVVTPAPVRAGVTTAKPTGD